MGRMSVYRILPVKVSVTIDTMLNFDCQFDGDVDGAVTCKKTLSSNWTNEIPSTNATHRV